MEPIPILKQRRVILGVTGGIAAYKAADLASKLTQAGAQVDVVMTAAATRFVAPLTFHALTGRPVWTDLWTPAAGTAIPHVALGEAAELVVIAPATADFIARMAHGLADDLLSALCLSTRAPILIAPAMDVGMWANPVTRENVERLRARGVEIAGPAYGRMASGLEGWGRMVEPMELLGHIRRILGRKGPLAGRRVVVTAGPTYESIDPVRFIGNRSSGKQGFALAQAALDRGAEVVLIAGPVTLETPVGARRIDVGTAAEMAEAVWRECAEADVLLMAAAVADYRPAQMQPLKIRKGAALTLELVATVDILEGVAARRLERGKPRVVVGFAAETGDLLEKARAKLQAKGLDLIVANDVTEPGAGFAVETNRVTLIDTRGHVEPLPLMSKAAVAEAVLDRVVRLLQEKG
ncbi:Coenzyme A biosynthesis bifunctional protein CoaBC [Candidatus Thermoflexus japonica]|uniref:Coenzyme A biosynthesis bifunctional protein CoaBC n=1 Tax=Candidatus Thermoflexus japonica TaxID=2035417 RepID=A0A2H5Y8D2_9CHLR|nr:Coenzyme A biosynthesis bifunctional protein CoaBC [Candidatus Thermoflexus japonica]